MREVTSNLNLFKRRISGYKWEMLITMKQRALLPVILKPGEGHKDPCE